MAARCPSPAWSPRRGLRHAFTQMLQTQPGKPMTIHLTAVNQRTASWPTRLATATAAFAALWMLVAAFCRRRPGSASAFTPGLQPQGSITP